jgi:drug/metabolite transporter (DMT)-like permease
VDLARVARDILALAMPFLREPRGWAALRAMGWLGVLFVAQGALGMIFYLCALTHTSVANVAVIYATTPFMAAVLAWWLLRERPGRGGLIASAGALFGVAVMVGFGGHGGWLGDAFALGMALTMAVTTVVVRRHPEVPVLLTACLSSLLSGVVCWPFGEPLATHAGALGLLATFGVVNFAIGLPLFVLGARRLSPVEIGALDAPLAPLWVWLVVHEAPNRATLIGGAIVFASVAAHLAASELGADTALEWRPD